MNNPPALNSTVWPEPTRMHISVSPEWAAVLFFALISDFCSVKRMTKFDPPDPGLPKDSGTLFSDLVKIESWVSFARKEIIIQIIKS